MTGEASLTREVGTCTVIPAARGGSSIFFQQLDSGGGVGAVEHVLCVCARAFLCTLFERCWVSFLAWKIWFLVCLFCRDIATVNKCVVVILYIYMLATDCI